MQAQSASHQGVLYGQIAAVLGVTESRVCQLHTQTVARLRGRFEAAGHRTVVWHSHLSDGERLDGWLALAEGRAGVVVGARSAVFAPVHNLKLVVVDEEHEPAYKQDETPRYHGRDVAVYRARCAGAVCVLGSATPSLESFANARAGKYRLSRLTRRVDDKRLPDIQIVDMRVEVMRSRGAVTLSRLLVEHLHQRLERREQGFGTGRGEESGVGVQALRLTRSVR